MVQTAIVRLAARVLVIAPENRILLLSARSPSGEVFWLAPGGGVQQGETFAAAAHRELMEETGLDLRIGPCVWTRRHSGVWGARQFEQAERFFVATTELTDVVPRKRDSYITGHRWWSVEELQASDEKFAPRKIGDLLPAIFAGNVPEPPIDCGT